MGVSVVLLLCCGLLLSTGSKIATPQETITQFTKLLSLGQPPSEGALKFRWDNCSRSYSLESHWTLLNTICLIRYHQCRSCEDYQRIHNPWPRPSSRHHHRVRGSDTHRDPNVAYQSSCDSGEEASWSLRQNSMPWQPWIVYIWRSVCSDS